MSVDSIIPTLPISLSIGISRASIRQRNRFPTCSPHLCQLGLVLLTSLPLYTTDLQAEVLVFGEIELKKVLSIHVPTQRELKRLAAFKIRTPVVVDGYYFRPRDDWQSWQREPLEDSNWRDILDDLVSGEVPF